MGRPEERRSPLRSQLLLSRFQSSGSELRWRCFQERSSSYSNLGTFSGHPPRPGLATQIYSLPCFSIGTRCQRCLPRAVDQCSLGLAGRERKRKPRLGLLRTWGRALLLGTPSLSPCPVGARPRPQIQLVGRLPLGCSWRRWGAGEGKHSAWDSGLLEQGS